MNSEMGFSSKLRRLTAPVKCLRNDPRGTRHRARNIAPHTSHEGSWVKRALHCQPKTAPVASLFSGPALSSFPNSYQQLTDGGPVELWATH
jgi:hypothetical protein